MLPSVRQLDREKRNVGVVKVLGIMLCVECVRKLELVNLEKDKFKRWQEAKAGSSLQTSETRLYVKVFRYPQRSHRRLN